MAKFDCAMTFAIANVSKEELVEKWTKTTQSIDEQKQTEEEPYYLF